MGCCHPRRTAADSDTESAPPEVLELFTHLEQQARMSESTADSADEPLPCSAALRRRVIVLRAGMRHNITADPEQFAELALQQEPEVLPRDIKRVTQWIDDVMRHTATGAWCPVEQLDQVCAARRNARKVANAQQLASSQCVHPDGSSTANAGNNSAARYRTLNPSSGAVARRVCDREMAIHEITATPAAANASPMTLVTAPPSVVPMGRYVDIASAFHEMQRRARGTVESHGEAAQPQPPQQQDPGGSQHGVVASTSGTARARRRATRLHNPPTARHQPPAASTSSVTVQLTSTTSAGPASGALANAAGVVVDSRGVFTASESESEDGDGVAAAAGVPGAFQTTNSRARLLAEPQPSAKTAAPVLHPPSYARQMILQHSAGFGVFERPGGITRQPQGVGAGRGPRRQPPAAEAEIEYSESSDPDNDSDNDGWVEGGAKQPQQQQQPSQSKPSGGARPSRSTQQRQRGGGAPAGSGGARRNRW